MPIIDLNQLPAPDVVEELDFETILAERKATLISLYPEDQQEAVARTLTLESEPLVKLLEENAYRELIWRQRVNEAARAVMLACAAGNDLDVIGANYNTTRLIITPADDSTIPPTPAVMDLTPIIVCVFSRRLKLKRRRVGGSLSVSWSQCRRACRGYFCHQSVSGLRHYLRAVT